MIPWVSPGYKFPQLALLLAIFCCKPDRLLGTQPLPRISEPVGEVRILKGLPEYLPLIEVQITHPFQRNAFNRMEQNQQLTMSKIWPVSRSASSL